MRPVPGIIGWLPSVLLTACAASHTGERQTLDRLLTLGDIHIEEARLRDFGFEPGPDDGTFTAETQGAIRAFQARYGLPVSGLLDRATREELRLGVDPKRAD